MKIVKFPAMESKLKGGANHSQLLAAGCVAAT